MRSVHRSIRRHYWQLAVSKLFLAFLVILTPAQGQSAERLIFGHTLDSATAHHRNILWAAGEMERALTGRYTLEVIPQGQIGTTGLQVIEGFRAGIAHMAYLSWGYLVDLFPSLSIGAGPFVFRDFAHWQAFRDSSLYQELVEGLESQTSLKVLGLAYYGQRHVTTKQPLTGLDSLQGLPIRVPNMATLILTFRALGAKPVPLPFKETYQALQDGSVEAQENPFPAIKAMRFYEQTPVINLTAHTVDALLVVMDNQRWQALAPQDQAVLKGLFHEAARRVTDEVRSEELALQQELLQAGATINPIDRMPLRAHLQSFYRSGYFPWSGSLYERIQALRAE